MKYTVSWDRELFYEEQGYKAITGLDEVGRGCWAGPLVAVAYQFTAFPTDIIVADSKTLSAIKRVEIANQLHELGHIGIGEVLAEEIDQLGLQAAQYLAYEKAMQSLSIYPDVILLDGRQWYSCPIKHEAIVKGDAKVASIAAASIIAKVYRDTLMREKYHTEYPFYGFNEHVGYGTKQHQAALKQYGVTAIHRKSYKPIQSMLK